MRLFSLRRLSYFVFIGSFLTCGYASAQAPLEPPQLPPRTIFYLISRGAPSSETAKTNGLLSLWDDPDFAPTRAALLDIFLTNTRKKDSKSSLTREELQQYATLIENPFVLGYIGKPQKQAAASDASPASKPLHPWSGIFLVYDRTGKEALLSKAILRMRSQEKELPLISQIVVSGQPVLKIERKSNTTYWVETGKFAVSAEEQSILEEILPRLGAKSATHSSLAEIPAFQEAAPMLGAGSLEFFLRVPDLKEFSPAVNTTPFPAQTIVDALRLDTIHSVSGSLSLEGTKTHLRGALLGDAAPGTLFDVWPNNEGAPASLSFASAEAISYTSTQINLAGIYAILKRCLRAMLPATQQGNTDMLELAAQTKLGMPLGEAFELFTGDFGSLQTSPTLDQTKQIFFFGIRKKPDALKLLGAIFGDRLAPERSEGEATFLKVSLGGGSSQAGLAQWNFYDLAVTPDFIFGSSRAQTLRDLLAQRAQMPAGAGLAALPAYLEARAHYPGKINGMSFYNFQKVDWQGAKETWLEELRAAQTKAAKNGGKQGDTQSLDWLEQLNTQVFPRHLHVASGATWKDAKGIHFEEWVE